MTKKSKRRRNYYTWGKDDIVILNEPKKTKKLRKSKLKELWDLLMPKISKKN